MSNISETLKHDNEILKFEARISGYEGVIRCMRNSYGSLRLTGKELKYFSFLSTINSTFAFAHVIECLFLERANVTFIQIKLNVCPDKTDAIDRQ